MGLQKAWRIFHGGLSFFAGLGARRVALGCWREGSTLLVKVWADFKRIVIVSLKTVVFWYTLYILYRIHVCRFVVGLLKKKYLPICRFSRRNFEINGRHRLASIHFSFVLYSISILIDLANWRLYDLLPDLRDEIARILIFFLHRRETHFHTPESSSRKNVCRISLLDR